MNFKLTIPRYKHVYEYKLIYVIWQACRKVGLNTNGFLMQNLKRLGKIILACWSGLKKDPRYPWLVIQGDWMRRAAKTKALCHDKDTSLCSKPLRAEHIRLNFAAISLRKTLRQLLSIIKLCIVMQSILLPFEIMNCLGIE